MIPSEAERNKSWRICVEEDGIRSEFKELLPHIAEHGFTTPFQWYAFVTLDQDFQSAMLFQNHYQWYAFRALGMEFDKAIQMKTPEMISLELRHQTQKGVPHEVLVRRPIEPDAGGGDADKMQPPQQDTAGGCEVPEDAL